MDGNIFISWSGQRSRELATAIKKFVPYVIRQAKPWMSTDNIDKGSRWSDEINQALVEERGPPLIRTEMSGDPIFTESQLFCGKISTTRERPCG